MDTKGHGDLTVRKRRPRTVFDLDRLPQLPSSEKIRLRAVTEQFAFKANDYYLGLVDWYDPDDPIRRLIIPHRSELSRFGKLDPSNEKAVTVCRGVQHKYESTVLLLVNETCPAFCRYCFRKRLFANDTPEAAYDMKDGLEYVRQHPEVSNVLMTGGDPLVLSTPRLEKIVAALRCIDHVRIIRIGSKMPAFNPFRILNDDTLVEMLAKYSWPDRRIYLMCHFDHPRELTSEARQAVDRLLRAGVVCVNQNPIIRGISDDPDVMAELWNELSFMGVPQYYVFQCRPAVGNEPYSVPVVEAYHKIEQAKKLCSGLAKRLKYGMSHESGKIEIVGVDHRHVYLKYHRAKRKVDEQRFIVCHRDDKACWLDQLRPVEGYRNDYYRAVSRPDSAHQWI
ncbi:MAG: KamA family radical SAM protein [Candidatus Zixiibacteriota bacterium]|nr:MAG: KamA family radical SAM protein [candidate division Zixibacteria bacterium]